jgi:REP element-mobilizing transposase RayT
LSGFRCDVWAAPFTQHRYHIIFSTKQRRPLIKDEIRQELREYLCGIARNTQGKILNVNGMEDHLHVLANIKPSISVSDFVRTIKANSSRWASERTYFV